MNKVVFTVLTIIGSAIIALLVLIYLQFPNKCLYPIGLEFYQNLAEILISFGLLTVLGTLIEKRISSGIDVKKNIGELKSQIYNAYTRIRHQRRMLRFHALMGSYQIIHEKNSIEVNLDAYKKYLGELSSIQIEIEYIFKHAPLLDLVSDKNEFKIVLKKISDYLRKMIEECEITKSNSKLIPVGDLPKLKDCLSSHSRNAGSTYNGIIEDGFKELIVLIN